MQLARVRLARRAAGARPRATGRRTWPSSTGTRSSDPLETSLGVGAGAPPVETDDGLLLLFHERGGTRALHDQGGAARPRRRGRVRCRCSRSRSCGPSCELGAAGRRRQRRLRPGSDPPSRRDDLHDIRRRRPQRRGRVPSRYARAAPRRSAPPPERARTAWRAQISASVDSAPWFSFRPARSSPSQQPPESAVGRARRRCR